MPIGKKIARNAGEDGEQPSRSAKKRASTALQKLGEKLAAMSPEKRKPLELPEDLAQALAMHDKMTNREAARRQRQFIGRLMRELEPGALEQIQAAINAGSDANILIQQRAEKLRQDLLDLPDAGLEQAVKNLNLDEDRSQAIISAVREAKMAGTTPNGRRAYREIYRLLCQ